MGKLIDTVLSSGKSTIVAHKAKLFKEREELRK